MMAREDRDSALKAIQEEGRKGQLGVASAGMPPADRREAPNWKKVLADPQATRERSRGGDMSL